MMDLKLFGSHKRAGLDGKHIKLLPHCFRAEVSGRLTQSLITIRIEPLALCLPIIPILSGVKVQLAFSYTCHAGHYTETMRPKVLLTFTMNSNAVRDVTQCNLLYVCQCFTAAYESKQLLNVARYVLSDMASISFSKVRNAFKEHIRGFSYTTVRSVYVF
jgi:hypothetical protein